MRYAADKVQSPVDRLKQKWYNRGVEVTILERANMSPQTNTFVLSAPATWVSSLSRPRHPVTYVAGALRSRGSEVGE